MVPSWTTCIVYCLSIILVSCKDSGVSTQDPIVSTTGGKIRGTTLSLSDHDKHAFGFFNIPYVAPPVGDLRFQPPQPVELWDGIRDSTKHGPICPQDTAIMRNVLEKELGLEPLEEDPPTSEDCLYLNVYTPALNGRRPVMLYIHGGGFTSGWASTYDMRVYAVKEDIIGVTIQYRLGALGWLSTGDDVVEGNMGFRDQVAALHWVQNNIDRFGGDPNQVTIFGESAGSLCVSMHLLSPLSKGLFHRGIMQSGSIIESAFFSPPMDPRLIADKLGSLLGCSTSNSVELVECLCKQPATDIISGRGASQEELASLFWVPRLDQKSLSKLPIELLETGEYNSDVDMIVGVDEVEVLSLLR